MSKVWVIYSSLLIVLGKISQLSLLLKLADEVIVPEGVAAEVGRGPIEILPGSGWRQKAATLYGWLAKLIRALQHGIWDWARVTSYHGHYCTKGARRSWTITLLGIAPAL